MEKLKFHRIKVSDLEKAVALAKGKFTLTNFPTPMPQLKDKHALVGVQNALGFLYATEIKTKEDYDLFLKRVNESQFICGGAYTLYSLPIQN